MNLHSWKFVWKRKKNKPIILSFRTESLIAYYNPGVAALKSTLHVQVGAGIVVCTCDVI